MKLSLDTATGQIPLNSVNIAWYNVKCQQFLFLYAILHLIVCTGYSLIGRYMGSQQHSFCLVIFGGKTC